MVSKLFANASLVDAPRSASSLHFPDWGKKLGPPASGSRRSLTVGQVLQAAEPLPIFMPGFRWPARRILSNFSLLMVHESHISPDDYPMMLEHIMAPTLDQLAGRTELLDELAEALPLAEAAEILGPKYIHYLQEMCARNAPVRNFSSRPQNPILARPFVEALIAAQPDEEEGRELRAYCRAWQTPLDYAALLTDYDWLARRPLRDLAYWTIEVQNPNNTPEDNAYFADRYTQQDRYRRTHYCLASAWAHYRLGNLAGATEAFDRAFAEPARDDFSFDPTIPIFWLPPVPDHDYLLWQVNEQLRGRTYAAIPEAVRGWLGRALYQLSPGCYAHESAQCPSGLIYLLSLTRLAFSSTSANPKHPLPSSTALSPTHSRGPLSRHTWPGCRYWPSQNTPALVREWSTISGRVRLPATCGRKSRRALPYA